MVAKVHAAILCCLLAPVARGDPADILSATAERSGEGYLVSVTLFHADTGWDHYADAWRVELEDGATVATRILLHPHVTEQPFTRSLSGVELPDAAGRVFVRARTNRDGWGKKRLALDLDPAD